MRTLNILILGGVLSASALVTGCGDGGSGATPLAPSTKATISTDNYKELALAATTGTKRAASGGSSVTSGFALLSGNLKTTNSMVSKSIGSPLQDTSYSSALCENVGGIADITGLENINQTSGSFNLNIAFTDCVNSGITLNGAVAITSPGDGSFSATYSNFSITSNGETESISGSISCAASGECTENFAGDFDNRTYETDGFAITGNDADGYNGIGTVIDPDFGEITVTISGVIFACPAPAEQPSAGTITIIGDGDPATLTFNGCTEFSVTYQGVSQTFSWATLAPI